MKTSEKNSKTSKSLNNQKITNSDVEVIKSGPSEDEIREKAEEIYYQRIDRGEPGSSVNDWLAAEEYLSELEGK